MSKESEYPLRVPTKDYTKIANWRYRIAVKELSGNAYKLLDVIYYQTIGCGSIDGIELSNRELMTMTGLASFTTLHACIDELTGQSKRKKGNQSGRVYLILTKGLSWDRMHYQINTRLKDDESVEILEQTESVPATETVALQFLINENDSTATESVVPATENEIPCYRKCSVPATENVDMNKTKTKKDNKNAEPSDSAVLSNGFAASAKKKPRAIPTDDHSTLMRFLFDKFGAIPDGGAQGRSIKWLLGASYSVKECIACFESLKNEAWRTTRVSWITVQKEIGAWKVRQNGNGNGHSSIEPIQYAKPMTMDDFENSVDARARTK